MQVKSVARELAFLLVFAAAFAAHADEIRATCSVKFFGSSTLHDFEGVAPCALLQVEPLADGAYRARVEVEIAQLRTGISARDKRMRQMFEAKRHPRVIASFDRVDPAAVRAARPEALSGRISIHGVERPFVSRVTGYRETAGKSASFAASFGASLRDFALEAPVVMGFIQVEDAVRVEVSVALESQPAT